MELNGNSVPWTPRSWPSLSEIALWLPGETKSSKIHHKHLQNVTQSRTVSWPPQFHHSYQDASCGQAFDKLHPNPSDRSLRANTRPRRWETERTYKSENFITSEECQLKDSEIWRIKLLSITQSSQPVLFSAVSVQVEHGKTTETSLLLHPVTQWHHLWIKIVMKQQLNTGRNPKPPTQPYNHKGAAGSRRTWLLDSKPLRPAWNCSFFLEPMSVLAQALLDQSISQEKDMRQRLHTGHVVGLWSMAIRLSLNSLTKPRRLRGSMEESQANTWHRGWLTIPAC